MSRTGVAFVAVLALAAGSLAGQEPPSPYDVTTFPVLASDPRTKDVAVTKGTYGDGLAFEIAALPAASGAKRPAVVFVNGSGLKLQEWEIYRSWARLVAAHGMAGITFETRERGSADAVKAFFAHLAKNAAAWGVDPARLGAWMCSGNVVAGLPAVMAADPLAFRALVVYYGSGESPVLRKDVSVYWVLALRDDTGLVERQRALFRRAVDEGLPWTMVVAPDLPHAFDAVEDTPNSRRIVRDTVDFLATALVTPAAPTARSAGREAVAFTFAKEYARAAETYRAILAKDPSDRAAARQLAVSEYNEACRLARAGRRDEAFLWLNRAADDGFRTRAQYEKDADLESLHADPRWKELLGRLTP